MLSREEKTLRVARFEKFIEERLKVDLQNVSKAQDKLQAQLGTLRDLRNTIVIIQKGHMDELTTMVDLGSQFYVQALIPDTSRIYVEVGLGFHVEYTLDEALSFIAKKECYLNEFAESLNQKGVNIKSHIQQMYEGIAELLSLS